MKGQMKVKKLNDTGLYISEMDWDNESIFIMIVQTPDTYAVTFHLIFQI